jgi:hypothetical protein
LLLLWLVISKFSSTVARVAVGESVQLGH